MLTVRLSRVMAGVVQCELSWLLPTRTLLCKVRIADAIMPQSRADRVGSLGSDPHIGGWLDTRLSLTMSVTCRMFVCRLAHLGRWCVLHPACERPLVGAVSLGGDNSKAGAPILDHVVVLGMDLGGGSIEVPVQLRSLGAGLHTCVWSVGPWGRGAVGPWGRGAVGPWGAWGTWGGGARAEILLSPARDPLSHKKAMRSPDPVFQVCPQTYLPDERCPVLM